MWFKQIQLFQLSSSLNFSIEGLTQQLEQLTFTPCLPSLPSSMGWAPVCDEDDAPMIRTINGCLMFCLQIEEKILPATVVRQTLDEKIKKIQTLEDRKVRYKEKLALKDEVTLTLLPRAFSKLTRVYAYIDTNHQWLVLGTVNAAKTQQFIEMFNKCVSEENKSFELKKLSPVMTHWLKEKSYPSSFAVEKSCMLQDPQQQNRMIRCQQQDLFANSVQAFIKDGCEVKQLALSWQDQLSFVLHDDFTLRGIRYQDEIREQVQEMEAETKQQQFDADFVIMSATLSGLLKELLEQFLKPSEEIKSSSEKTKLAVAA